MWYIDSTDYHWAIKNNGIMPFTATCMYLETIILNEVSQRKTNIIGYHLYVKYKNNDTNEPMPKREIESQTQKANLCLSKGGKGMQSRIN